MLFKFHYPERNYKTRRCLSHRNSNAAQAMLCTQVQWLCVNVCDIYDKPRSGRLAILVNGLFKATAESISYERSRDLEKTYNALYTILYWYPKQTRIYSDIKHSGNYVTIVAGIFRNFSDCTNCITNAPFSDYNTPFLDSLSKFLVGLLHSNCYE